MELVEIFIEFSRLDFVIGAGLTGTLLSRSSSAI
jgi:hypothetical protein